MPQVSHFDWSINITTIIAILGAFIAAFRVGLKVRDTMRDGLKDVTEAVGGLRYDVEYLKEQTEQHKTWLVRAGLDDDDRRHHERRNTRGGAQ